MAYGFFWKSDAQWRPQTETFENAVSSFTTTHSIRHVPDNSLWNRKNFKSLVQFALKVSSSRCHWVGTCRRGRNLHLMVYVIIGVVTRDAFSVVNDPFTAWSCVSVRERESIGIPPLRDGDRVISSNSGKSNVLNSYFKSVFTAEVTLTIPSNDSSPFPDIADNFPLYWNWKTALGKSQDQMKFLLGFLKTWLINVVLCYKMTDFWTIVFAYQKIGRERWSLLSIKRVTNLFLKITDPFRWPAFPEKLWNTLF